MELKTLLKLMADKSATDLHLAAGAPPVLRISGQLVLTDYEELTSDSIEALLTPILSAEQKKKFQTTKELDFPHFVSRLARFRVNLHMQKGTIAA